MRSVTTLAIVVLIGCTAPGDPTVGTRLMADFDSEAFWDAPFPSEHRRAADGTVDLSTFPRLDPPSPFVTKMIDLVDGRFDGFGTTSAIYFRSVSDLAPEAMPDTLASTRSDSPVFLIGLDPASPDFARRVPADVQWRLDGGPFGATRLLSILPLQGRPLYPSSTYAAVVLRELRDDDGELLAHHPVLDDLADGVVPPGMSARAASSYSDAITSLAELDVEPVDVAGLAVFRTQDPTAELSTFLEHARNRAPPTPLEAWTLEDVFDDYCVLATTVEMPVYQGGEPPFLTGGGGEWVTGSDGPELQSVETATLRITVPRRASPAGGWPVAVFIRTGGGGDRPLIDRGFRPEPGVPGEPGEGPAVELTAAGWVGLQVDGPHGGLRNVTGGDEQFLIFSIGNPAAMRDNVRQSALELALVPDLLDGLEVDVEGCDGASSQVELDPTSIALIGHSMGATIAPLTLAVQPRYRHLVLSGAGGSWLANIVHKQSPLEVRPIAEGILRYGESGHELHEHDPILTLLQWAGEAADPPVYGRSYGAGAGDPAEILMVQGIVDTYILPPIANATTLSAGLTVGGPVLDEGYPGLDGFRSILDVVELGEFSAGQLDLPIRAEDLGGPTTVLVQYEEDGIEDGHEIFFQSAAARRQLKCFLETARGGGAVVVRPDSTGACP